MNLYLISQNYCNGYDTYDSAVVVAATQDEAIDIHPSGEWPSCSYDWVDRRETMYVDCKIIGVAAENLEAGTIVCASYNAG